MANKSAVDVFLTPKNESFPYHEVYSPLSTQDKQIRLMSLASGAGAEPIRCEVYNCSFATLPQYEALSYCAGDPVDCAPILLNGTSFNVFRPLDSAFRHLRKSSENRLMWVDQICINQTDLQERSLQVNMMKEIYQGASKTLAWLGEPVIGNDAAFDILDQFCAITRDRVLEIVWRYKQDQERLDQVKDDLKDINRSKDEANMDPHWWIRWLSLAGSLTTHVAAEPSLLEALEWIDVSSRETSRKVSWEALKSLALHSWYERCWIVQEVAVSSHLVLISGVRSVDWNDLVLFKYCLHILWIHARNNGQTVNESLRGTLRVFKVEYLNDIRRRTFDARNNLCDLLTSTIHCSASDCRDKVYALLGLCGERKNRYHISVDYSLSKTATAVFTEAVKAIALVDEIWPFDLLGVAEDHSGMPSWVPNFFKRRNIINWDLSMSEMGKAGGTKFTQPAFLKNDTIMEVPGIKLRYLNEGLALRHDKGTAGNEVLRTWINIILTYLSEYSGSRSQVVQTFLEVVLIPDEDLQDSTMNFSKQPVTADTLANFVEDHLDPYFRASTSCRFFLLHDGTMGLVPGQTELGDLVFVPCGAEMPIVVRETETSGNFKFVGVCYVHGIMRGELFEENPEHECKLSRIQLV